ncbi:putative Golgin subfamily A member 6-like protein 4 [Heracleum sosnowskyi]|uniref:Golgin subfamily A member 6-like protein 4 n=1 Tax=Heracleum sosnowskyi TaxID=360622 RepID=A0AAD8M1T9_9APIA|nr:putative Golgin subfamily A member 6-like protein 4 [Heracleum sosnowskyi]
MEKLIEFGRRAMFYARVLSGYEERRIRSYRLQIQQRLAKAEERKAALRKIPEQVILSEVRRMVEEMQSLNKKLEETEAAIDEYFSPLDKEAETIMKIQLEGEEKSMKEMVKTMQRQAILEKEEAERIANVGDVDAKQHMQDKSSPNPPGTGIKLCNAKEKSTFAHSAVALLA